MLHNKFHNTLPINDDSPFWKCILASKDLLLSGAYFLVGARRSINMCEEPWVLNVLGFRPMPIREPWIGLMTVKDLIIQQGVWSMAKLYSSFELTNVNAITVIQIPLLKETI